MKKVLKIIAWIVGILILFGIFGYYKSVGFTKKQKYENCAETCEKIMLQSSNIPLCKMRCAEIADYDSSSEEKKKEKPKTPDTAKKTAPDSRQAGDEAVEASHGMPATVIDQKAEYYCEWSWPQKIIEKDSAKVIFACPSERPWCDSADRKYENVGCCGNHDEGKKIKTDCIKLPELLKK